MVNRVFSPGSDYARMAESLFDELRAMSADVAGVSRPSYGEMETQVLAHLERVANSAGLASAYDGAGNLWMGAAGDTTGGERRIVSGSHADSVPRGGNFDGLAGIVAAILCAVRATRDAERPRLPVAALGLRGEESAWFGKAYLGSAALLGQLTEADLARGHRSTREPLSDYMRRAGVDPARCLGGKPMIDLSGVAAFLELHIEQGPMLEEAGRAVGVVTGIRGNFRYRQVRCIGEAGHSGTVPKRLRRDAVFAVSDLLSRIEEAWEEWLAAGEDLVVTSGMVHTNPDQDAPSIIAGEVGFSLEVRSQSMATLERFHRSILEECASLEQSRGVRFEFGERIDSPSAVMDSALSARMAKICRRREIPFIIMPSGAGHDAALFSNAGVPSGMVFVRNAFGSHNPQESMSIEDFLLAADVLYDCMLSI